MPVACCLVSSSRFSILVSVGIMSNVLEASSSVVVFVSAFIDRGKGSGVLWRWGSESVLFLSLEILERSRRFSLKSSPFLLKRFKVLIENVSNFLLNIEVFK